MHLIFSPALCTACRLPGETLLERLQNGRFVELFAKPVNPFANWELYLSSTSHWTFWTTIPSAKLRMGGAWWIPLVSAGNLSVNHGKKEKTMVATGHPYHRAIRNNLPKVGLQVAHAGGEISRNLRQLQGATVQWERDWLRWKNQELLSWWKEQMVQIWHSVSWFLKSRTVWCDCIW